MRSAGLSVFAAIMMFGCMAVPDNGDFETGSTTGGVSSTGNEIVGTIGGRIASSGGATGPIGPSIGSEFGGTFDEPVVVADSPPPPVSGGTLIVTAGGKQAALSDPDHDQVVIVDIVNFEIVQVISLQTGDEPGRLVEDGAGRIHVALRGGGAVATIDPAAGVLIGRDSLCEYPRGLTYDSRSDVVHVACAGGELVTVPAAGGAPIRSLELDRDLRDVIIDGDGLVVSRFRTAELLYIDSAGNRLARMVLPPDSGNAPGASLVTFTPAVAWRLAPAADGGFLVVYQEHQTSEVLVQPGGYGGNGCGGIVRNAVSLVRAGAIVWTAFEVPGILPVDVAQGAGGSIAVVSAAGRLSSSTVLPVTTFSLLPAGNWHISGCSVDVPSGFGMTTVGTTGGTLETTSATAVTTGTIPPTPISVQAQGQAVAVAFDPSGRRIVQTREPYTLLIDDRAVTLPGDSRQDTGHRVFHLGTAGGLACASCHPEGRDDGHVWNFSGHGARRTQSIGGGILGTEPFHWDGDMTDFETLAHEVFGSRMIGPELSPAHAEATAKWIDRIPAWKAAPDPAADDAASRGLALFNDPTVGCVACHGGDKFTNNQTMDVGTGAPLQVPSLRGVAWRAPFLHDGCAATLADRFGPCGGGDKHGHVSSLTPAQISDLVAYLESL